MCALKKTGLSQENFLMNLYGYIYVHEYSWDSGKTEILE